MAGLEPALTRSNRAGHRGIEPRRQLGLEPDPLSQSVTHEVPVPALEHRLATSTVFVSLCNLSSTLGRRTGTGGQPTNGAVSAASVWHTSDGPDTQGFFVPGLFGAFYLVGIRLHCGEHTGPDRTGRCEACTKATTVIDSCLFSTNVS